MLSKALKSFWLVGLLSILPNLFSVSIAAEMSTLFSTPQERRIIDNNRYKKDEVKQARVVTQPEQTQQPELELKTKTFTINGITVTDEGQHSVWINSEMYLDGDKVEGKSRVKVIVGNEIKVRITAPDGKHYFATSGESLEVKYLEAADS